MSNPAPRRGRSRSRMGLAGKRLGARSRGAMSRTIHKAKMLGASWQSAVPDSPRTASPSWPRHGGGHLPPDERIPLAVAAHVARRHFVSSRGVTSNEGRQG
jgi:hypothetical protein